MSVIGRLLLGSIDLPLPEGAKELVEWFAGLNVWRRGRHGGRR